MLLLNACYSIQVFLHRSQEEIQEEIQYSMLSILEFMHFMLLLICYSTAGPQCQYLIMLVLHGLYSIQVEITEMNAWTLEHGTYCLRLKQVVELTLQLVLTLQLGKSRPYCLRFGADTQFGLNQNWEYLLICGFSLDTPRRSYCESEASASAVGDTERLNWIVLVNGFIEISCFAFLFPNWT